MPVVTFGVGTPSSFNALLGTINTALFDASAISFSPTQIVLQSGGTQFVVTGSNFSYVFVGGQPVFTGGIVDKIVQSSGGVTQLTLADIGLGLVALQNAVVAEENGSNPAAVEDIFLNLDWTYTGKDNVDFLAPGTVSSDGIEINLQGADKFYLNGGADVAFIGGGNDLGYGGTGNDKLYGGTGNDRLFGDADIDRLFGGAGVDRLNGGVGNDFVYGGANGDQITGGTGNDTLDGGSGADRFIFANGDGRDKILGFDLAADTLDVARPGSVTFTASGANTLVHYGPGADTILLVGVTLDQSGMIDII